MEERNVYCGAYFTKVLLKEWAHSLSCGPQQNVTTRSIHELVRFVYVLQRIPAPGVGLQRWTSDGHNFKGPFASPALCGTRNKARGGDEGTRRDSGGAVLWGEGSADNCGLWRMYQVREKAATRLIKGVHAEWKLFFLLCLCRCWNLQTDRCEKVLYGHTGTINCLDVHADKLVSGAKDHTVKGKWQVGDDVLITGWMSIYD